MRINFALFFSSFLFCSLFFIFLRFVFVVVVSLLLARLRLHFGLLNRRRWLTESTQNKHILCEVWRWQRHGKWAQEYCNKVTCVENRKLFDYGKMAMTSVENGHHNQRLRQRGRRQRMDIRRFCIYFNCSVDEAETTKLFTVRHLNAMFVFTDK